MYDTNVTVVGNVVDLPNRRVLESGASVTTFRVGSTARRFDRGQGAWIDGDSLFLRVTCWRQLADNAYRSLVKGDPVVVTGRLFTRSYEHEGQRRSAYEMEAAAIGPDLARGTATFLRTPRSADVPHTFEVEPGQSDEEMSEPAAAAGFAGVAEDADAARIAKVA